MRAPPRYRPTFRPSHGSNRLAGCERDRCPRERDGEDLADHRGAPGMAEEVSCSRVCTAVSPIVVATAVLAMYRSHSSPRPDPSSRRTGSRCTRTGPRSAGSGSGATVFERRHRPKRSVTPGRDVRGDRTDGYSTQPPGRSTEARRPAGQRPGGRGRSAQSQNNISRCFATLVNGALQDRESRVPRSHGHQHRHLYDRPNHRPGDIPSVHRGRPGIAREDRRTIRIAGRGLDRLFPLKHRPGRGPGTDQPLDRQAGRDRSPPVDVPAGRRRRPVLVAGRLDRLLSLDTIGQFAGLEGPALRG